MTKEEVKELFNKYALDGFTDSQNRGLELVNKVIPIANSFIEIQDLMDIYMVGSMRMVRSSKLELFDILKMCMLASYNAGRESMLPTELYSKDQD